MLCMTDIILYIFKSDFYCPDHIVEQIDGEAPVRVTAGASRFDAVEEKLDYIAGMLGINREDEATFDSDDFPKCALRSALHYDAHCVCAHRVHHS